MAKPPTTPENAKTPHPIDVAVGRNLRAIRKRLGATQEIMAKALGLTFQQVQKYEKGANRISASKLYDAAEALGVNVEDLFVGLPRHDGGSGPALAPDPELARQATLNGGVQLARAFTHIRSARSRRLVVDLAIQLATADAPPA